MGGIGGRRGRRGVGHRHHNRNRQVGHHHRHGGGGGLRVFVQGGAGRHLRGRMVSGLISFGLGFALMCYGIFSLFLGIGFEYGVQWRGISFTCVGTFLMFFGIASIWKVNMLYRVSQRQQDQQQAAAGSASQANVGPQLTTQPQSVWTTGQQMTAPPTYGAAVVTEQGMTAPPPYGAGPGQPPPGYPQTYPQQPYQQPYPQAGVPVQFHQQVPSPGGVAPPPPQPYANGTQLYQVQPYSLPNGDSSEVPYPPHTNTFPGPAPPNAPPAVIEPGPPPPSYDEVVTNELNK